jgi:lipopolysaccharide/colanic/teichoic acid biosynthesis glycosyltransferase
MLDTVQQDMPLVGDLEESALFLSVRTSRVNEAYKRFFDILFSLFFLILLAIPFFIIALLIKMNSPGPVFYLQERVTKDERRFNIMKFRTMPLDVEQRSGPVWALEEDVRTDGWGKFLRITRIDELPQLFNMLKGDMSFIGPRPERSYFVEHFKQSKVPGYERRHQVRTGLMGYAQVKNPLLTMQEIDQKTEYDLHYIENWIPSLDLWVIQQTFGYVIPITKRAFRALFEGRIDQNILDS